MEAAVADKVPGHRQAWRLLEYGAEVNAVGPRGHTALHYAACAGRLRVVTLLLNHAADPTLCDDEGKTALALAHETGQRAVAERLRAR